MSNNKEKLNKKEISYTKIKKVKQIINEKNNKE